MKRAPVRCWLFAAAALLLAPMSGYQARAGGILYTQPYDGVSPGVVSQTFPDSLTYSTHAFDDVTVTGGGWNVQAVTIYGMETGNSSFNLSVSLQFQSTSLPSYNDTTDPIYSGTEDANGNLQFTNLNVNLSPGTYWITAWIDRPFYAGGNQGIQWFWDTTNAGNPIGSEYYLQNPGASFLGTSAAVPASTVLGTLPSDLAFTLYGASVPEPMSVILVVEGELALLIWHRHARRCTPALKGTRDSCIGSI